MTDEIGGMLTIYSLLIVDFETENVISNFKFRLTNWTLDQYSSMADVLVRTSDLNWIYSLQRNLVCNLVAFVNFRVTPIRIPS
jgi:hypothetical protein